MRSPLPAQTEAGCGRYRRYKGEDPRTVEVLAALVDSASQTTPLSGRFPADVQHLSPPDSRPRSLPRRLLPGRGATVSTARRAARLAPAARAPPHPPRPGRIAQLRPPAPRLQAALAPPPTAAPNPRSLVRSRGAAQSEPGIPALLLEGRGRGGPAAPERSFGVQRGRPFYTPKAPKGLAGIPQISAGHGLGFVAGPGGNGCFLQKTLCPLQFRPGRGKSAPPGDRELRRGAY